MRLPGASSGGAHRASLRVAIPAALAASAACALLPASLLGAFTREDGRSTGSPAPRTPHAALARRPEHKPAGGRTARSRRVPRRPAITVSVGLRNPGAPVPPTFLGLSFEGEAVPILSAYWRGGTLDRLMSSLGAGVLRIGGVSADKSTAWAPEGTPPPSWASTVVSDRDVKHIATLLARTGWQALWTVNLGHYDPVAAAGEAAAAKAALGARLLGVEIGNEPNAYVKEGMRAAGWSIDGWLPQLDAYRQAIAQAGQGIAVAAPDASSGVPALRWVRATRPFRARMLTDHFYPLTSCGYLRPTIDELLGAKVRSEEGAMLARLVAIMRASARPLRIDETNDISCHGEAGVSNSFASALWAVDWTLRAMRAGVSGLNFHDLLDEPGAYSPLVLSGGRLHANPEWYALLMASRVVGYRPLAASVSGSSSLTAGAFLGGSSRAPSLAVAVVDFGAPGSTARTLAVRAPARFRVASVLRLAAPSPAALSHVTLGGSEVAADGSWRPQLPLPRLRGHRGTFTLAMSPGSAALLTLSAR